MRLHAVGCLSAAVALAACLWGAAPAAQEADADEWEDLLPGKDLKGWRRVALPPDEKPAAKNPWSVDTDNRVLVCDGVGVKEMLLHEKERGDGTFRVEWRFRKVEGKGDYNSGVYVRSRLDGKAWHQVQVAHQDKLPRMGDVFGDVLVGGKVERVVVTGQGHKHARPPGQWNTCEVTCKGKEVRVRVNGAAATAWDACPVPRGHVGLQAEYYYIEFKNLKFRPLR